MAGLLTRVSHTGHLAYSRSIQRFTRIGTAYRISAREEGYTGRAAGLRG